MNSPKNTAVAELNAENIIAPVRGKMAEVAEDDKSVARIANAFSIAVMQQPSILECTAESIQSELLKCAFDGLVPDGKEAVILDYNENIAPKGKPKKWVKVANYQPMIYGIIKRMKELGGVFSVTVDVVKEKDTFHANRSDPSDTQHTCDHFATDRGDVVGAYCIIRDDKERVIHREIMSKSDIDKVQEASKAPKGPAWSNWYEEMCKKAVLRRASKYITLDNQRLRSMIERLDHFIDLNKSHESERSNPFATMTEPKQIEAEAATHNQTDASNEASGDHQTNGLTSDSSDAQPSQEDEKPEDPEELAMNVAQEFSDFLWKSKPDVKEMNIDIQQFKSSNTAGKSATKEQIDLFKQIETIHLKRCEGGDSLETVEAASIDLAEIGIEVKENLFS